MRPCVPTPNCVLCVTLKTLDNHHLEQYYVQKLCHNKKLCRTDKHILQSALNHFNENKYKHQHSLWYLVVEVLPLKTGEIMG